MKVCELLTTEVYKTDKEADPGRTDCYSFCMGIVEIMMNSEMLAFKEQN